MAKNTFIRTLPAEEQEALALCGITEDTQLAQVGPRTLRNDLETAISYFPDALEVAPGLERLEYICRQAAIATNMLPDGTDELWQGKVRNPSYGAMRSEGENRLVSAATGRVLVKDELDPQRAKALDERRRKDDPRGFNHAICCQHPVATYFAAWSTVLLIAAVIALILGVAGLLIGIHYGKTVVPVLAVLGGVILFYFIMMGMATCSTCRVPIFSFRRYTRHRKAHHFPLLGYTLSTALYIIFMFRYRCPSCGTTQKFFGKRRNKKR